MFSDTDTAMELRPSTGIWESAQHGGVARSAFGCVLPEERR